MSNFDGLVVFPWLFTSDLCGRKARLLYPTQTSFSRWQPPHSSASHYPPLGTVRSKTRRQSKHRIHVQATFGSSSVRFEKRTFADNRKLPAYLARRRGSMGDSFRRAAGVPAQAYVVSCAYDPTLSSPTDVTRFPEGSMDLRHKADAIRALPIRLSDALWRSDQMACSSLTDAQTFYRQLDGRDRLDLISHVPLLHLGRPGRMNGRPLADSWRLSKRCKQFQPIR